MGRPLGGSPTTPDLGLLRHVLRDELENVLAEWVKTRLGPRLDEILGDLADAACADLDDLEARLRELEDRVEDLDTGNFADDDDDA